MPYGISQDFCFFFLLMRPSESQGPSHSRSEMLSPHTQLALIKNIAIQAPAPPPPDPGVQAPAWPPQDPGVQALQ